MGTFDACIVACLTALVGREFNFSGSEREVNMGDTMFIHIFALHMFSIYRFHNNWLQPKLEMMFVFVNFFLWVVNY